ncbi:hypothetical protein THIOSC15_2600001 [uncultured Thiomicrorhabdus sp.]
MSLIGCNGLNWSSMDQENCDNDKTLTKHYFKDGVYDDQLVTISAY